MCGNYSLVCTTGAPELSSSADPWAGLVSWTLSAISKTLSLFTKWFKRCNYFGILRQVCLENTCSGAHVLCKDGESSAAYASQVNCLC